MIEIELKVKVGSLDPLRERLVSQNAEFIEKVNEHDIYYNAPHRDFSETDEALRVRYTHNKAVLTYKGMRLPDCRVKAREEVSTALESGELFELILQKLGFTKTAEVDKIRESYRMGAAFITLDRVRDLGTFVEIEIMGETSDQKAVEEIEMIAQKIGAEGEPILCSYLELLLTKPSGAQQ